LRDMSKQYKKDIETLAKTNPGDVMPVQEESEKVAELIVETTQILEEIRHAALTKSRELLQLLQNDPRYPEMDAKLQSLGYGGRKTRKHRKKRKSRR
jgi:hypothetical protein